MPELPTKVQIESPFGAPTREGIITNVAYALLAMRDSLIRGEAPFASHLLYTQMLNDQNPAERTLGIEAGLVLGSGMDLTVVYDDLGVSRGMQFGITRAEREGRPIICRQLYPRVLSIEAIAESVRNQSPLSLDTIAAVYARTHDS